uniref:brain-specific serine protease 4-like isoform X1 n=1 Tax=Nyctereutes procyonoides TaxID=34880 RepID=UPI002444C92B|nr:brain-specific serine protease 4-like isoform X1 [Nyctereutes procyonoides]
MVVSRGPPAPGGGCLRIVTPLLLLASSAALRAAEIAAPPACGKPQQLNRIVGGEDSTDAQWPWVVSIQKNGTHHCAGSLLSSRWVVTAAHCFKGNLNKPSEYSVLLGTWQLGNPGPRSQEVGIAWVLSHPVYSWREGSRADIALVRLEHSVRFSERILPICLPDSSVHLLPNTRCWIAGWGSVRDGVPLAHPQTLQKLEVPIIDSEICSRLYWRGAGQEAITEDMLCAGYLEGQRDACLVSTPPSSHIRPPELHRCPPPQINWDLQAPLDASTWLGRPSVGPHTKHPLSILGVPDPLSGPSLEGAPRPGPQHQLQHCGGGQQAGVRLAPGLGRCRSCSQFLSAAHGRWARGCERGGPPRRAPRQGVPPRPVRPRPPGACWSSSTSSSRREMHPPACPPGSRLPPALSVWALSSPGPRGPLTSPPPRRVTPGAPSCAR